MQVEPKQYTSYAIQSTLMALAAAPPSVVITTPHVAKMCTPKGNEEIQNVDTMIKTMIELSCTMGTPASQVVHIVGNFRVSMATKMFAIPPIAKKQYEEICHKAF